ncbi:hypothetical protein [Brevibacillus sp. MER 51]|uniref:hypothetical protein n=1 Tax=Brevibacillus sp. MER 51 TaxID=2939560 RepID=UPI00203F438C|nr:hypothetical protein [Brevibacillus sp. MER 51]MCM3141707.1 hypothetical protein [Brevibacillus sp. MER 51]
MLHMLNRGDAVMEKHNGKFAAVYHFGETTVFIDDSCMVKTPEEREKILDEIRAEGIQILKEEARRRIKEIS